MHSSLIPDRSAALETPLPPPVVPIYDAHMHASGPGTNDLYVEAAKKYGVAGAVGLMHGVDTGTLLRAEDGFFLPCVWGAIPGRGDGDGWARAEADELTRQAEAGARAVKYKVEPSRGKPDVYLDDPRLAPVLERAAALGLPLIAHIAQPSGWWPGRYDPARVGDKDSFFVQVEHVLRAHPDLVFVGAHMGGYPERPDYIRQLIELSPRAHFDTSATKWVVRECGRRRDAWRQLLLDHPDRFLFGSDLVVMFGDCPTYYTSRFHVQRQMWEGRGETPSMIADPDAAGPDFPEGPVVRAMDLPETVLRRLYHDNAVRVFGFPSLV